MGRKGANGHPWVCPSQLQGSKVDAEYDNRSRKVTRGTRVYMRRRIAGVDLCVHQHYTEGLEGRRPDHRKLAHRGS
jgi:hypothetical protein